jgi:hypothetical protein
MIFKTKPYLFLKICLKIDVNILICKFCTTELKKLSPEAVIKVDIYGVGLANTRAQL